MGFYQPLFTVSIEHSYFVDGLWKGLDFVASPATSKMTDGAGILVKVTENGIGVFYDEDKAQALRLYATDTAGLLRFSFKVYAKDKAFENYTTPYAQKENSILCFGNLGKTGDAEGGKIRLSELDFVSEADFTEMDALIAEETLNARDRRVPPDFVVNICVEPGNNACQNIRDFCIRFSARQSFWKYYLLGNMNRGNAFIVDLDNRVEFEPCGDVVLPGNRPAKVFRSKERIPVLEKSSYRFQLREQGQGGGKVLVKRLPVASESRLGREAINGKSEIVLENYVNF